MKSPRQPLIATARQNPHPRALRKHISPVADLVPDIVLHHPAVRKFHRHRLHIPVTADLHAHFPPRRNLLEHPPQLLRALDILPVQLQHHVVDLQPNLPCRRIVVDQRNHRPAHVLELQRLRLLLIQVGYIHTKVALRGRCVPKQRTRLLRQHLHNLASLRPSSRRRQGHPSAHAHQHDDPKTPIRPQKVLHLFFSRTSLTPAHTLFMTMQSPEGLTLLLNLRLPPQDLS